MAGKMSFLLFSILVISPITNGYNPNEARLRDDVFTSYNKDVLPNTPTNVSVRFHILHVNIKEDTQEVILDSWLSMEWYEYRFSWSPEDYDGLQSITTPPDTIWKPDLAIYNSGNNEMFDMITGKTLAILNHDGKVIWVPTARVSASCILDLTLWPSDVQNCSLKFGSWVHSAAEVDFFQKDDGAEMELPQSVLEENGPWKILNSTVVKNVKTYSVGTYVSLSLHLLLQRVAPVYCCTVKLPAIGLSLATGLLFLLPPGGVEKAVVGAVLLVLDLLFMGLVTSLIKQSSAHSPLILELLSGQFILTLVCLGVSCLVIRVARSPHPGTMPGSLERLLIILAKVLCLPGFAAQASRSQEAPFSHSLKGEDLEGKAMMGDVSPQNSSWVLLASVIDRIFFLVYVIVVASNLASFSDVF